MHWNLIGHSHITNYLENAIQNDQLSHAYLFYGPKSIGKKTLVMQFIKNLMCYDNDSSKKNIPCQSCDTCKSIEKNLHPDIYKIKKEIDKKNITVEQIRLLEEKLSVHSFLKGYKIAILENVEDLNPASANALLKTLEEPTSKTILILTAQSIKTLPKTIISRVQKIKLLPVSADEIYKNLEIQTDSLKARHLSKLAMGRPGRALSFLKNEKMWQAYQFQLNNFFEILNSSRVNKFKFAEKLLANKDSLIQKNEMLFSLLNLWQLLLRDINLINLEQPAYITNSICLNNLTNASQKYSLQKINFIQNQIEITKLCLTKNVNPRLTLENLLLAL